MLLTPTQTPYTGPQITGRMLILNQNKWRNPKMGQDQNQRSSLHRKEMPKTKHQYGQVIACGYKISGSNTKLETHIKETKGAQGKFKGSLMLSKET